MTRPLKSEEVSLWREAMRGVRPLRGKKAAEEKSMPPDITHAAPAVPARRAAAPSKAGAGLDRRSAQRLKRGEMAIEGRLDLHGLTQEEAHRALQRFVLAASEAGTRLLLVITGKGSGAAGGVLRAAVPRWLAEGEVAGRVLAATPAQPRHGGAGAFYVLLRRRR
jgi:DNA-nicking Smr family endonuclease